MESEAHKKCERCGGTGNELLSYYRRCSDCGGTGLIGGIVLQAPKPPPRRLLRKARSRLRVWWSRWTGGTWFGPWERCVRCGIDAHSAEFFFRRQGWLRRPICAELDVCEPVNPTGEEKSK